MNTLKKKKVIAAIVVLLLIGGGGLLVAFQQDATAPDTQEAHDTEAHTTPDHQEKSGLAAYDEDGDGVVYQDPMHPQYVQDEPGTAPDCGMDLVPVRVDGEAEEGTVQISPATIQNMGVRTARVEVASLAQRVRTTGRFEANEQLMTAVSPKVDGWVERLHVNYEGDRVRKGQPLLTIYSPELVSTQEEYLLALRNAERLGGSDDAQRLVDAARRRLAYWDISEEQIERLEATGEPTKTLTLHAPASGTVSNKNVTEGERIQAGQTLMHLSDLSRLWLMLDIYEQNLLWIDVGSQVEVELPYAPGETLTGRVDYIYDQLNPETRTVKARITVPNPDLKLKPGMYATAVIEGRETAPTPLVPEEAVVSSGERDVVVLALGEGRFRPVPVRTGAQSGSRVQVLSGLEGGEQVVTSAQFLIDSEARLQSAIGAMTGHEGHGGEVISPEEHSGEDAAHDEHGSSDNPPASAPSGHAH